MSIIGYDPYTNRSTTGGPVDGESSIQIPQCELVKTVELSKEAIDQIAEAVAEKLAAKMEPPKTGKWIAVDSFSAFGGDEATWEAHGNPVAYYYCSVCKKQNYVDEFGESILSNYCPDCGAYMGGEG